MNVISVITPVYAPVATYILETYESLISQELPDGWDWQWVVQEDGQTGEVAKLLPNDPRISTGMGRRGGSAVARTMALARAEGSLIKALDADDMLTPGVLARDIDALTENSRFGWATSRVLDLMPDGSTVGFDFDPSAGTIPRGAVLEHWRAHDYRAQVHPATLCVKRRLLFALGGWMALPASCDTGLLMGLNAVSDGYFSPEVGMLYRKWEGQVTGKAAHVDLVERSARMRVIEEHAQALAALGTAWGSD